MTSFDKRADDTRIRERELQRSGDNWIRKRPDLLVAVFKVTYDPFVFCRQVMNGQQSWGNAQDKQWTLTWMLTPSPVSSLTKEPLMLKIANRASRRTWYARTNEIDRWIAGV